MVQRKKKTSPAMNRKGFSLSRFSAMRALSRSCLVNTVGVFQQPLTLILPQKHLDANGSRIRDTDWRCISWTTNLCFLVLRLSGRQALSAILRE